jgi:rod shape determining protein RodA
MAGYGRRGLRVGEQFDWPLFLCIVTVAILGVVNLYSATSPYLGLATKSGLADIYVTQVYWLVVGGLFGILVAVIDYRNFERIAYIVYGVGLLALAMIFVLATDVRGAARWIRFGSFAFQPSEFMKIAVILAVARFLADEPKTEARTLVELFPAFLLCGVPFGLVMLQPDLGTAMIYLLTAGGMLAMTRIRASSIALAGATLAVAIPLLWVFGMRDYQKARVTSFLNPEADLTGTGWHAFQSQTAIGNGGIWGMGFREGTQNQFGFLPDQFSDFPFSVFAEDWGFLGVICVLSLYCFISVWAIKIASMAKDRFGAAVSIGVGAMIFWHAVINMGMVLGILPVVGVTLPLFSYGGSSVLTILIGFGLLMNVSMRR